jgi:hypothetical protein
MEGSDLDLRVNQYQAAADALRDGGDEAGESLHLLREDAFDHFTMPAPNSWRTNVPVVDEVEEMVRTSLGGNRNAAKFRNKVRYIYLFTLQTYI